VTIISLIKVVKYLKVKMAIFFYSQNGE